MALRQGTGTWTVLFTDLVDSTRQRIALGDEAADEVRRIHDRILTDTVNGCSGHVIKGLGDGIMAAFEGAADALQCAVSIQQAVDRHNRGGDSRFDVRVGVSLGDARVENGDLFGTPVVEAARLCALADGGGIICTEVVRAVAGSRAAQEFESLGLVELKGLPESVPALRVLWESLPDEPEPGPRIPMPPGLHAGTRLRFVGRTEELGGLRTQWGQATDTERALGLIAGEPGVGKTRLAIELAERVHAERAVVLYGRCDDELGVPYQPFVEALAYYVEHEDSEQLAEALGPHGGDLARLVPAVADRVPSLPPPLTSDPETEQYRLFEAVVTWLAAVSRRDPVLLVLDDLHWAAKPTLLMLRHIVGSAQSARLLVVGTYRDTDLARTHPLSEALADLRRLPSVTRIPLTGLDQAGVIKLLETAAGHELDEDGLALAVAIHAETEGNPFFVSEVLRHLAETGGIVERDGRWVVTDELASLGIPEGVREVIGRRLNRLSDAANETLVLASVIGRGFELDVLGAVSELDEERLLAALDEAVNARLLREDDVGRYRFSHALVRSALYDELRPTRRARIHRRVGEAIEKIHADRLDEHFGELAHHFSRSVTGGELGRALEYARRAGERALEQLAHEEAVAYFEQARELVDEEPGSDHERGEVLLCLGIARRRAGVPGYREVLLEAARLGEACGDAQLLASAALAVYRGFFSTIGDVDREVLAVVQQALDALGPDDRPERSQLLANLATELLFADTLERRREISDEAVAMARRLGDDAALAHALITRCSAIWFPTTHDERLAITEELVELAERQGDPYILMWAVYYRYTVLVEAGAGAEADEALARMGALASEVGQPSMEWINLFTNAGHEYMRGHLERAEALIMESLEVGQRAGQRDAVFLFGVVLFALRRDQARLDEIVDLVRVAVDENAGLAGVSGMLGLAQCELGHDDEAGAMLDEIAAQQFDDFGRNQIWTSVMWGAAAIAHHLGDEVRAAQLIPLLEPHSEQVVYNGMIPFYSLPAILGELCVTAGRREDAEHYFGRAIEIASRMGAEAHLQRARVEWAEALLNWDRPGDAKRARDLLADLKANASGLLPAIARRVDDLAG